jgi:addiction module HigA family antidote
MRRPTHPGVFLREELLPAAEMNQTELAGRMRVSRRAVNELCQERRGVSTDMAHRLARAFGNSPEFWLHMQQAVDLWEAAEANKAEYEKIPCVEGFAGLDTLPTHKMG